MPTRLSTVATAICGFMLFALCATACGSLSGDEPTPVPTVESNQTSLLPPPATRPADEGAAPATAAVAATAAGDEAVDEPLSAPPSMLSCLSNRARVAQLLLPLATQGELGGAVAYASAGDLGGIGLLGEPDGGLAGALAGIQQASFVPVMVASDEEGGSVQRLANLLGPIPSAAASAQSKSPDDVRKQWLEYGSRVKAEGIDVVFGPVLDVGSAPGIASRSFGDDPAVVAAYGRAVADGLLEAGVMPVFKHFPGHGRATADSHLELPGTPSLAQLRTHDLVPYVELLSEVTYRDSAGVMVGHLAVPGLSDETPTSLSPATVSGLLRGELGFGGLIFTDALNMGAIVNTYGRLDALELAILAGSDVLILGSLADLTPALDHLHQRFEADPAFAATIENRAARVLVAKGQSDLCAGAQ